MGSHRTTIRRKQPLTHLTTTKLSRRKAIKTLHTDLKSSSSGSGSIPLAVYQQASSKGQDPLRGGDSSKVLVQWLKQSKDKEKLNGLKVLEVGCLDVDNAIAKYIERQKGSIRRIDLKSRDPRIEEQDFMSLPLNEVSLISFNNCKIDNRNTIWFRYRWYWISSPHHKDVMQCSKERHPSSVVRFPAIPLPPYSSSSHFLA